MATKRRYNLIPTVEQIQDDIITQLSNKYWAPFSNVERLPFGPQVIEDIYHNELKKTNYATKRIMLLEFSQYLENYLWPNFSEKASKAHVMSIMVMVNEKHRERIPAWNCFKSDPEKFEYFFKRSMTLSLQGPSSDFHFNDICVCILFFIHAFNSMANDLVRNQVMRLVSPMIWHNVLPSRRDEELDKNPLYKRAWKKLNGVFERASQPERILQSEAFNFLSNHLDRFLGVLGGVQETGELKRGLKGYCERVLEWLIDLQAQLHSRRFLNLLLQSKHVMIRCFSSHLHSRQLEGKLFRDLLERLEFYCRFEINDQSGEALNDREVMIGRCNKMSHLQMVIFKNFPELKHLALTSANIAQTRDQIKKDLAELPNPKLHFLLSELHLLPPPSPEEGATYDADFMMRVLVREIEEYPSQLAVLNQMPLYPTEDIIWNENIVPQENPNGSDGSQSGSGGLALPKLNLQFLTIHDYLLRNFNLFRLESTYEVRQDIEDAVYRLKPWLSTDGSCHLGGWARMAHSLEGFTIFEVGAPNVGENKPSRVRADVTIDLKAKSNIRNEWMSLRKHDVIFLVTLRPMNQVGTLFDYNEPFVPQVGLVYVRGCEIEGMLDDRGKVIEEGIDVNPELSGTKRTFRVFMDPNQYKADLQNINQGKEDPYQTFNVVIRRKPKENNFKAVLETIRDLMNIHCVVPEWITNILLGLNDPDSAHYSKLPTTITSLDWKDTFLNFSHLKASFPTHNVIYTGLDGPPGLEAPPDERDKENAPDNLKVEKTIKDPLPPYKLTFTKVKDARSGKSVDTILVKNYKHLNRGPYRFNQPKTNQIAFTPTQVEAIKSGMQPGLTMVVGPPGTGKTDVAVQIISNIYHNFPEQRTLLVTHSNQALNQLFEKIMSLDVEERHLLRMGHGEDDLDTENDYSRYGRVNYVLDQRLSLLEQVNKLHLSFGLTLENQYTCELAGYFYVNEVLRRHEEFLRRIDTASKDGTPLEERVSKYFPFSKFFDDCSLFCNDFHKDLDTAQGCFRYISKIFKQLEEFRPFELLRNGRDRSRYLLIKEAKIIAMTCTHAALKRRDLVESLFQYDNILMEESAQILEIETFIPLLLQNPDHGSNRLKRWIMIGDHHQLPPVIKNMAFQKFSNMEQSLFTRFVRLGVPTVDLDAQGRSRPSICNLYNWRYKNLGNLPHLHRLPEYRLGNPGLFFDFQLVDVQDYNGVGESEPNPFFYQNLAEAEYIGGFFTYLRLVGYPSERITILTTYNGQKHLLRDVIQQRCASNRLIGKPLKITTVDRYQGQQNDVILLSLVRTKNVGHLRDVRRLVVATSRARLGLYIFGRTSLFQNCFELTPTFSQLLRRPLKLHLAPSERYDPSFCRKFDEAPKEAPVVIESMPHMTQYVYDLYKQKVHLMTNEYNRQVREHEQKLQEEREQEMLRKQEEENERIRRQEEDRLKEEMVQKEREERDEAIKKQAMQQDGVESGQSVVEEEEDEKKENEEEKKKDKEKEKKDKEEDEEKEEKVDEKEKESTKDKTDKKGNEETKETKKEQQFQQALDTSELKATTATIHHKINEEYQGDSSSDEEEEEEEKEDDGGSGSGESTEIEDNDYDKNNMNDKNEDDEDDDEKTDVEDNGEPKTKKVKSDE